MAFIRTTRTARPGLTLVELLVVVTIVVILLAVVAPLARTTSKDRKLREAARQVNTFLAGAQARAMERGRSVWVSINRVNNSDRANEGGLLAVSEVVPPYTGDTLSSMCRVTIASGSYSYNGTNYPWQGTVTFDASTTSFSTVVQTEDRIRFNYQGLQYRVAGVSSSGLTFYPPSDRPTAPPPPSVAVDNSDSVPYRWQKFQIYGQPRPMSVAPVSLPNGTCVDFSVSGQRNTGYEFDTSYAPSGGAGLPAYIGFGPSGKVEAIQSFRGQSLPLSTTHLLIGWSDKIGQDNLRDSLTLWVTIDPSTGAVTTAENYYDSTISGTYPLDTARKIATSRQSLGGR